MSKTLTEILKILLIIAVAALLLQFVDPGLVVSPYNRF